MMTVERCHLCFASFFELSFVFCGIIINQLFSQVGKQHSLFLSHHGFHRGT
jgi:hypothetical protein